MPTDRGRNGTGTAWKIHLDRERQIETEGDLAIAKQ